MRRDGAYSPVGWYGAAAFLALCGAGATWLAWFAASRHPDFPSEPMDWAIIGFPVLLFGLASACAFLGRALARRARWADTAVLWLVLAHALLLIVTSGGMLAKSLGWI